MTKRSTPFSPEVCERAVRMVFDHQGEHGSQYAAIRSAVSLEPCEKRAGRVSSTALVRYHGNDYSVPTAYGFRDVLVKGFVEGVVILCGGVEIARHERSYGTGVFVSEPLHYLALIETKPNALDQAAALQGWDLPEAFQHLRHLLEARMGNRGKREFIQLLEARDERRLLRLQRELAAVKLLIVDELGYVPLSPTGAELLFEVFSQRYERGSTVVTSNLPFEDWTSVLGSERLTGALLDRLTHHVSILSLNGDSYRLKSSRSRRGRASGAQQNQATTDPHDPETGEIVPA